jgi:hypothetical protein
MKQIKEYEELYQRMLNYLSEAPSPNDYEYLLGRLGKLGILLAKSGEYLTDCQYQIDSVIDIECQVNIQLLDKFTASTFNMMIKTKAKDWTRLKTGFEKCNSTAVHQIDAIRSMLSFEKAKMNLV